MTRLATQAELIKLARTLGVSEQELAFLQPIPQETLRHFRAAVSDFLFDEQRALVRWLANAARWLPSMVSALLARVWLRASLTARLAAELPAWRVANIARFLPAPFLADIATSLDPRSARELVMLLPVLQIKAIAAELLTRKDYVTMGRFVGLLPDDVVSEVAASIPDEGDLLDIVFHIESPNRLDHLINVLPSERIDAALALVSKPEQSARWPSVLALLSYVGFALKRSLGERVVELGNDVLSQVVLAADEKGLWEDLIPVVASLSTQAQAKVVKLPEIRQPELLHRILLAIDACRQWPAMLSLAAQMDESTRDGLALALAQLSRRTLERVAYAALMRAQWHTVFDIVKRLPDAKRAEAIDIMESYLPTLDDETAALLRKLSATA
ncbi:MAG: hypothetical protein Q8K94_07505 [Moraxellaceae bacterium]|nr:hypothetical protein [Moraxellaceae bacterium]MDP1776447.1 hypothetical protein [Moraxellaceae bacterium]